MAIFRRRSKDLEGISSTVVAGKEIKLMGNQVYKTKNPKEIKALREDSVFFELPVKLKVKATKKD
jgi:hypothetical protein